MARYTYQSETQEGSSGEDCCADQPCSPQDQEEPKKCPKPTPPVPPDPKTWDVPENKCCKCPTTSEPEIPCLKEIQELIGEQADAGRAATEAALFKKELEDLLKVAKDNATKYTPDIHRELAEEWQRQDLQIAELLRTFECAVKCWRCVVDCYLCPLFNQIHHAEQRLFGRKQYEEVYDLYDQRYWYSRLREARQRRLDRVNAVVNAWKLKPVEKIRAVLGENKTLHADALANYAKEPGKWIYPIFLKLVPIHLAIAPPAGSEWKTKIHKRFTEFCKSSEGKPDVCCGPDMDEWGLRQRLIGPYPNLIDPADYLKLVCCIITKYWKPARLELGEAALGYETANDEILLHEDRLKDWPKKFGESAKSVVPVNIACRDFEKPRDDAAQRSMSSH